MSSLFLVSVTAQTSPYDPWADLDDDGDIDIFDIVDIAGKYGTTGTPINKTEVLLGLLDRMDSVEERMNQSRWITLYSPNLTAIDEAFVLTNVSTFTWIPNDPSNCIILNIRYYFRCSNHASIRCELDINDIDIISETYPLYTGPSNWTHVMHGGYASSIYIFPNLESYTLRLEVSTTTPTVYVKDVTFLLEVIDGLSASN